MIHLTIFLVSYVLTHIGMSVILRMFPKWGLLDNPKKYGLSRAAIPYSAGIIIPIILFLCMFLFLPFSVAYIGIFFSGTLLSIVSFIDDRKGLPAGFRLGIHILCALIIVASGVSIEHISNPFGGADISLGDPNFSFGIFTFKPLEILFTTFWIVFVMNAINLLDGIPGLVSGVGGIASLTIFGLSLILFFSDTTTAVEKLSSWNVGNLSLIFSGILLAFVMYDFFPPKVIIGDTGAMFIGFILAILSIISGGKLATTLIVLGLPLVDMLWVIIRRISKGQSPIAADENHYHHKLLRLGLSERQALLTFYATSLILGILSLYLLFTFKTAGKFVAIVLIAILIFVTSFLLIKKETNRKRGF